MRLIITALTLALTIPTTALADACMTGRWQADLADVATMMTAQMGGSAEARGGLVTMDVAADGSFLVQTDNMTIAVTPPNVPTVDVSVNGYSRGTFTVDGTTFAALVNDYALVGSADVLGQRMDIPFDASTGAFGNASGTYTCDATALRFTQTAGNPGGSMARIWTRLN